MYCGDETGSFIGDVGSHVCRFGYGGEDNPKLVTSSYVDQMNRRMAGSSLHRPSMMTTTTTTDNDDLSSLMRSILRMPDVPSSMGGNETPLTNPNSFLRQGDSIDNWDALEIAWETSMDTLHARDTKKHTDGGTPYHTLKTAASGVTSTTVNPPSSRGGGGGCTEGKCIHPILAVTPGMTEFDGYGRDYAKAHRRDQYERYTELLMESGGPVSASSCFLAPAPMLAAFSLGRQTALMVDMGAGGCRVTPICDGLVMRHHNVEMVGVGIGWTT